MGIINKDAKESERYDGLTRHAELARLAKLARDIKRSKKKALQDKIVEDFKKNPREIHLIAEKFKVTEGAANYVIDKYTRHQHRPRGN